MVVDAPSFKMCLAEESFCLTSLVRSWLELALMSLEEVS